MSLKLRIRWATQLNQGLPVPPPVIPVQAYSRDHQFLEITNSTDDTRYKRSSFSIPDRVVNDQWYTPQLGLVLWFLEHPRQVQT